MILSLRLPEMEKPGQAAGFSWAKIFFPALRIANRGGVSKIRGFYKSDKCLGMYGLKIFSRLMNGF
jgi:hypothetical protein